MARASGGRIESEHRRLRAVFGVALLSALGPAAMQACSSSRAAGGTDASVSDGTATASPDTSTDEGKDALDALGAQDVLMPDASTAPDDAAAPDCNSIIVLDGAYADVGVDAEICTLVLPCGLPSTVTLSGCELQSSGLPIGCRIADDAGCYADVLDLGDATSLTLSCLCEIFVGGGRRPEGFQGSPAHTANGPLAAYLTSVAAEEAASVSAFLRLQAELQRLGAPLELQRAARRCGRDEVRHARQLAALARRHGGAAPSSAPPARGLRDLEAVARENFVEGCVRETYAALAAHWQARRARDPILRRTFERIAADETRHAALAWAVARWAEAQLEAPARARVARAGCAAARKLEGQLAIEPDSELVERAGLPTARQARVLVGAVTAAV